MNEVDKRVVQMEFDNAKFEKNIDQTMKTLEDLNKALQMRDASKGFDTLIDDSSRVEKSMSGIGAAVDEVKFKLTTMQVVGYTVLSELTKTAINVGKQMASAVWSPIVAGGARRSQNIEAAKFQLEGLGVAWKDISEDINYGVKSTAYGLDSAARVASQLVASNILPGDLMRNTLRGISGVAAMTNSSYDEIGSIFTTVAGNGKLMTMQLRQLSYRGMNAAATLAKYLKEVKGQADVTEQAIYDMVSKGKIDFETFASAMDWAFGEHAKEANKTFTGAMSNVNAALARIGAKFADPVYDNLRQVFTDLIPVIDSVNKIIDPVVDGFTNILTLLRISVSSLLTEDFSKAVGMLFLDLYSYIRPLIGALTKVGILGRDLNGVGTGMLGVLSKLQLYGPAAEKVEHFFIGLFGILKLIFNIFKGFVTIVRPIFEAFVFTLGKIFGVSGDIGEVMWGVSNILSILVGKISKFIALKIERTLKLIYSALSRIDLNKVKNGIIVVINVVEILTKAIILLGAVAFALIARAVTGIPKIVSSLGGVFERIGSIYDAFSGKLSNIFGGGKKTANFEVNTEVNGPDASEMVEDRIQTYEDVMAFDNMAEKNLDDYEKHVNRASQAMKEFGDASKKTGDDVKKNAASTRKAAKDMADSAKEATEYVQNLFKPKKNLGDQDRANYYKQQGESKLNPEEEAKKSPIIRFFIALRDGIIFAAKSVVNAFLTAIAWVGEAIAKVFPGLGRLMNAIFNKVADFVENLDWINGLLAIVYMAIGGIVASIIGIFASIATLIGGAGLYLGGAGIAAALGAFESAAWSIIAFLTVVAIIAEHVDMYKFDHTLKQITSAMFKIMGTFALFIVVIEICKAIGDILALAKIGAEGLEASIKRTSPLAALTGAFQSLASTILAMTIMLVVVEKVLPDDPGLIFLKVLASFGTSLLALGIFLTGMAALSKWWGLSLKSGQTITREFGGLKSWGAGKTTNSSENGLGGLTNVIFGLAAYMAALTLAMRTFSKMSWGEIGKGAAVIGGALLAIAGIIAVIGGAYKKLDKTWNKNTDLQGMLQTGKGNKRKFVADAGTVHNEGEKHKELGPLDGLVGIIRSIGRYILAITIAMRIVSKLSWKEIGKGSAVIGGALVAIGLLLFMIAKLTRNLDKAEKTVTPGTLNRRDNYTTEESRTKKTQTWAGIVKAISSISWFLVAVTASMVILSKVNKTALKRGGLVLGLSLAAIGVLLSVLAHFTTTSEYTGNVTHERSVSHWESLGKVIKSLSLFILSVAAFLVIADKGIDANTLSGKKLGLILGALGGVAAILAIILTLSKGSTGFNKGPIIAMLAGLGGVLLALGGMFLMIGHANLDKMNRTFKKALLPLLITVGAILVALVVLANTASGITGLMMGTIIAIMASISAFLLAFAGSIKLITSSDLDGLSDNIVSIATIIGLAMGLFAMVALVSSQKLALLDIVVAAGVMMVISLFFTALANAINLLASIDSKKLEESESTITTIATVAALMFGLLAIFASVPAIGPSAILASAAAFIILAAGLLAIAAAINMLADSDMDKVSNAADAMTQVLLSLGAAALMIGAAIGIATGAIGGLAVAAAGALSVLGPLLGIVAAGAAVWYFGYHPEDDWDVNPGWDESDFPAGSQEGGPILSGNNEDSLHTREWEESASNIAGTYGPQWAESAEQVEESMAAAENSAANINNYLSNADAQNILHTGPGAAGIGNAKYVKPLSSQLDYIKSMLGSTASNVRNSGISMGRSLITGLYSAITSGKNKIVSATKEALDLGGTVEKQSKQISNMSKVLDEYGDSITKNITNKNREAIDATKELTKSVDNSSKSMDNMSKGFSKSASEIVSASKNIGNAGKNAPPSVKADPPSENTEQWAQAGSDAGEAYSLNLGTKIDDSFNGWLPNWMSDAIDKYGNMAYDTITSKASWLKNLLSGDFSDVGGWLGKMAGISGGENMLEMFGIYTSSYYNGLAQNAAQDITASQRALDYALSAREAEVKKRTGGKLDYDSLSALASQSSPSSAAALLLKAIDREFDDTILSNESRIATARGAREGALAMRDSTIYERMGLPDISELFGGSPGGLGGAGDYTNTAASDIAASSGAGSGINDSSIGGGGNTNINSNNTYNFTQNNYSPEALSRSDLYMQTRAQINAWYGWMRSQPAT